MCTELLYCLCVNVYCTAVLFVCKCVLYCCHRVPTQFQLNIHLYIYSEGKSNPLQALTNAEGSSSLKLSDFKRFGTWRWQSCLPYAPATFIPRKHSWYWFLLEAELTPGSYAAEGIISRKIPMTPSEINPATFRFCNSVLQPLRHRDIFDIIWYDTIYIYI
jgi:hypothetical protein